MMRHRLLLVMLPALFLFALILPTQTKGGDKKTAQIVNAAIKEITGAKKKG